MKKIIALAILFLVSGTAVAQVHPEMEKAVRGMERDQEGGPDIKMKIGDEIQDFDLEDLGGNIINTGKIRQGKVMILRLVTIKDDMWEIETELLNKLTDQFPGKLCVLDVVVPPMTPEQIVQQYENARTVYMVAYDKKNLAVTQLGVEAKHIPSAFIFDENGHLVQMNRSVPFDLAKKLADYFQAVEHEKEQLERQALEEKALEQKKAAEEQNKPE